MRGTPFLESGYVNSSVLPPGQVNSSSTILTTADDDAFYEQMKLEPPAGATSSNVYPGFAPLRNGPIVIGDAAVRFIYTNPMRVARSAQDISTPRNLISATLDATTAKAMPAAPAAGTWGYVLLYAQLAWVDASSSITHEHGTTVTLFLVEPAAYPLFAAAPNFGLLPANTADTWNVPIAYIRSYAAQAVIAAEDIIEFPAAIPTVNLPSRDLQLRISSARSGIDARRSTSNAENSPNNLVLGGTSKWVATAVSGKLTKTITPITLARRNVEHVRREICIPACAAGATNGTSGTGGVIVKTIILDDTRDWRGANFRCELWECREPTKQFGEDDPSVTGATILPAMADTVTTLVTGTAWSVSVGQSWTVVTPNALTEANLWAGIFANDSDVPGAGTRNGVASVLGIGADFWGVIVDPTSGYLKWWAKRAGAGAGPSVWILIDAWFGNHLP